MNDKTIDSICKNGLFPKYEILEELNFDGSKKSKIFICEREEYWIKKLASTNQITNQQHNIGGIVKYKTKCLYCDKEIGAKSVRKKFCDDKCRVYYARQIEYETRKKIAEKVIEVAIKDVFKYDGKFDSEKATVIFPNEVKRNVEPNKKWSLAEQLAQIELEEKNKKQ